jgi:uncharacterized damage-inducible protein DinB
MVELDRLLERFRVWSRHLEKICYAIGEREIEYRPMPESNSAAWILVHIITAFREFVELTGPENAKERLGGLPAPKESDLVRMPFSSIMELMKAHREAFLEEVRRLRRSGNLETICPAGEGKSWLDLIISVINHEIYHCGQLAYISKVLQQKARESKA